MHETKVPKIIFSIIVVISLFNLFSTLYSTFIFPVFDNSDREFKNKMIYSLFFAFIKWGTLLYASWLLVKRNNKAVFLFLVVLLIMLGSNIYGFISLLQFGELHMDMAIMSAVILGITLLMYGGLYFYSARLNKKGYYIATPNKRINSDSL